jgi:hypothetical protein
MKEYKFELLDEEGRVFHTATANRFSDTLAEFFKDKKGVRIFEREVGEWVLK